MKSPKLLVTPRRILFDIERELRVSISAIVKSGFTLTFLLFLDMLMVNLILILSFLWSHS